MGNLHRIERDRKMPLQGTSAQELHFLHLAESSPNRKGPQDAAARNICTGTTFSASYGIEAASQPEHFSQIPSAAGVFLLVLGMIEAASQPEHFSQIPSAAGD